jgi:hypothetical protein
MFESLDETIKADSRANSSALVDEGQLMSEA